MAQLRDLPFDELKIGKNNIKLTIAPQLSMEEGAILHI
jgi:hypothetical protein